MRDVWRVWALVVHATQVLLDDDVDLGDVGFEVMGLLSGANQFLDREEPPGELEEFPGMSISDAVDQAWRIVSTWESQEPTVVQFRLAMLDVRLAICGPLGDLHRGRFL